MARRRADVAVIGLGRMGAALATALARRDMRVLALDRAPSVVATWAEHLPDAVQADATDRETLVQLGLPRLERAVVAIGEELEASILATSLLSELGVRHIWAKATTEQHARILTRMGATRVVMPEQEAGERLSHLVAGRMQDYLSLDADYAFVKTTVPAETEGHTLAEAALRGRYGVTVVALQRAGGQFSYATPDTRLQAGDTLVVAGRVHDVERFADLT